MYSVILLGNCGLHIVHGALQIRMTQSGLNLHKVLHVIQKTFDELPARRDMYIRETRCYVFPIHFCKTRWVEACPVASQATEIWQCVTMVVKHCFSLSKSKRPKNNKFFDTFFEHHKDQLMIAKLQYFKYLASLFEPFLNCF